MTVTTLYMRAHALIYFMPWLNVELSEVAFVGRLQSAVVLGIFVHIFSSALCLRLAARHMQLIVGLLYRLVIVFQR